ncbi:MAG: hypothetical protein ACRCXZ_08395 [Patescibacteria group bacterium]
MIKTFNTNIIIHDLESYRNLQIKYIKDRKSILSLLTHNQEQIYTATNTEVLSRPELDIAIYSLRYVQPNIGALRELSEKKKKGEEVDQNILDNEIKMGYLECSSNEFNPHKNNNFDSVFFSTSSKNHINLEGAYLNFLHIKASLESTTVEDMIKDFLAIKKIASITNFYLPNYRNYPTLNYLQYDDKFIELYQELSIEDLTNKDIYEHNF